MEHLGWFFAGTSFGLFVGVLLTSLAKIAEMAQASEFIQANPEPSQSKLVVVRR